MTSEDHTVEAASGRALKVRSEQMVRLRGRRIALNRPEVRKQFDIEKILISLMADADESAIALLESCDQTWDPGVLEIPEDEEKKIEMVERLEDLGLYDTIEQIRVIYNLSDESEAIEKYKQLEKRAKDYPPLYDNTDDNMEDVENGDNEGDQPAATVRSGSGEQGE